MTNTTTCDLSGTTNGTRALLATMLQQVRDTRAAYYRGTPGITYETMADAAHRYLRMKALLDGKTGRAAKPTKGQVSHLLRAL